MLKETRCILLCCFEKETATLFGGSLEDIFRAIWLEIIFTQLLR